MDILRQTRERVYGRICYTCIPAQVKQESYTWLREALKILTLIESAGVGIKGASVFTILVITVLSIVNE